jgi:hypothetical protein
MEVEDSCKGIYMYRSQQEMNYNQVRVPYSEDPKKYYNSH